MPGFNLEFRITFTTGISRLRRFSHNYSRISPIRRWRACARDAPPLCSLSVEKCPGNKMLGRREIVDGKVCSRTRASPSLSPPGACLRFSVFPVPPWIHWRLRLLRKAGNYTWLTYKEVYDTVIKVGAAIRSCGVGKVQTFLFGLLLCGLPYREAGTSLFHTSIILWIYMVCWWAVDMSHASLSVGWPVRHLWGQLAWVGYQYAGTFMASIS